MPLTLEEEMYFGESKRRKKEVDRRLHDLDVRWERYQELMRTMSVYSILRLTGRDQNYFTEKDVEDITEGLCGLIEKHFETETAVEYNFSDFSGRASEARISSHPLNVGVIRKHYGLELSTIWDVMEDMRDPASYRFTLYMGVGYSCLTSLFGSTIYSYFTNIPNTWRVSMPFFLGSLVASVGIPFTTYFMKAHKHLRTIRDQDRNEKNQIMISIQLPAFESNEVDENTTPETQRFQRIINESTMSGPDTLLDDTTYRNYLRLGHDIRVLLRNYGDPDPAAIYHDRR